MFEINRDPMHESGNPTPDSLAGLIYECNVKNQHHTADQNVWVQSNSFRIDLVCPNTIEIFEPDVLSEDNDETGHTQVR